VHSLPFGSVIRTFDDGQSLADVINAASHIAYQGIRLEVTSSVVDGRPNLADLNGLLLGKRYVSEQ
jgi:hypothetical protein